MKKTSGFGLLDHGFCIAATTFINEAVTTSRGHDEHVDGSHGRPVHEVTTELPRALSIGVYNGRCWVKVIITATVAVAFFAVKIAEVSLGGEITTAVICAAHSATTSTASAERARLVIISGTTHGCFNGEIKQYIGIDTVTQKKRVVNHIGPSHIA